MEPVIFTAPDRSLGQVVDSFAQLQDVWQVVHRRSLFQCQLPWAAGIDRAAHGACEPHKVLLGVQPSIYTLKVNVNVIEVVF